jgi:hypothetical protein
VGRLADRVYNGAPAHNLVEYVEGTKDHRVKQLFLTKNGHRLVASVITSGARGRARVRRNEKAIDRYVDAVRTLAGLRQAEVDEGKTEERTRAIKQARDMVQERLRPQTAQSALHSRPISRPPRTALRRNARASPPARWPLSPA